MSNVNYGQTGWQARGNAGDGEFGKGTEFLRLQNGSNLIRIVTAPYSRWMHAVETEGGKSWGFNYGCVKRSASDTCPLCEMGNRAKQRFLLGVLEKKTGAYRILEIPKGVYNQIVTLTNDPDWKVDITSSAIFPYDLDLIKNPNPPSPSQTYSLVPKPPRQLSAAELAVAEGADLAELDRRSTPPVLEKLQEKLAQLRSDGTVMKTPTPSLFNDSSSNATDEGGDSFFKNYDLKVSAS